MRVFVYGTLKRGYGNCNRILVATNSTYVGDAILSDHRLFYAGNPGSFPVAQADVEGQNIHGEVWEIDLENTNTLQMLDSLEGEGYMYLRRKATVKMVESDEEIEIEYYRGNPKFWEFTELTPVNYNQNNNFEWGNQTHNV